MPKREIEEILINGDEDQIWELAGDTDCCVLVDWREDEQDMLGYFARFLPAQSLSFDFADGDDDQHYRVNVVYQGVRHEAHLTFSPKNRYLVMRLLAKAIASEHEFRVFRRSLETDTHSFLVRPVEWWEEMDANFPARMNEVFARLSEGIDFV